MKIILRTLVAFAFVASLDEVFHWFNFLSLSHIGATENGVIQGICGVRDGFLWHDVMNFRMNKIQWGAFIASAVLYPYE
ncbi:hypothetical protein OK016_26925 [Vibrio chagasii]|nr:hypothetical protein [Vibrio chagasii]